VAIEMTTSVEMSVAASTRFFLMKMRRPTSVHMVAQIIERKPTSSMTSLKRTILKMKMSVCVNRKILKLRVPEIKV
jgi:hypothetical protein